MTAKELLMATATDNLKGTEAQIAKLKAQLKTLQAQLDDWQHAKEGLEKLPDDFGIEEGE